MNATLSANGKARKTLADQIDRLDTILDGLAIGLNEAIAGAVQTSTREAVREAVITVLTSPELRAAVATTTLTAAAEPAREQPSFLKRMAQRIKDFALGAVTGVAVAVRGAKQRIQAVGRSSAQVINSLGLAWKLKRFLLIGAGVGVITAVVTGVGSHTFASIVSGIGAAVTTVAVQVGLWMRRLLQLPTT